MLSEMTAAGVIPTVDTFNTLMDACSSRHDYEAVVRLFRHMVQSGETCAKHLRGALAAFLKCSVFLRVRVMIAINKVMSGSVSHCHVRSAPQGLDLWGTV